MALAPGNRVGPYQIVSLVGAGGMGEVYEATDTRLGRRVALKVLPATPGLPEIATRRLRFEREAKAISALSHPNICALFDVADHEGALCLVMEYVEGETLARRLRRGPLGATEALGIAAEMASALGHAHRNGIVHRDVKPSNVMLTPHGTKLLDFGIARVDEPMGAGRSPDRPAPPATESITEEGAIVGTVAYMAPEQLEGKVSDARTDIFALGAVLYEMLTGQPAFDGGSKASLVAAIMTRDPAPIEESRAVATEWSAVARARLAPDLDHLLRRCLAKSPADRWQTAEDLSRQLEWLAERRDSGASQAPTQSHRVRTIARVASIAVIVIVGIAAWLWLRPSPAPPPGAVRFTIAPPPNSVFSSSSAFLALSPDGRILALSSATQGQLALWVRRLDAVAPERVPGAVGGGQPFWSPDGRYLAFKSFRQFARVDVAGGPVQQWLDAPEAQTGTWNRDNVILFKRYNNDGLYRMPAFGGEPTRVTTPDPSRGEVLHNWPQFLPDGRRFLFLGISGVPASRAVAYVGSLDSMDRVELFATDSHVAYAPPGYLLFMRGETLMAQPFDVERLRTTGEAVPIATQVERTAGSFRGAFSVSETGVLAYRQIGQTRLTWVDRRGQRLLTMGAAAHYANPALSPDGRQVAVAVLDEAKGTRDVWVIDRDRGTTTRVTFDDGTEDMSLWSPDGSRLIYASHRPGAGFGFFERAASGTGVERTVLADLELFAQPCSWAPGGGLTYLNASRENPFGTLWFRPTLDAEPAPILDHRFKKDCAIVSPNGRAVAYTSAESGDQQVYVSRLPVGQDRWQVSAAGGSEPAWRRDGRELFFLNANAQMTSVSVRFEPDVAFGPEVRLFDTTLSTFNTPGYTRNQYVVTADGQGFLLNERAAEPSSAVVNVVMNWPALAAR